jgi:PAS domain S-box-containing protein
MKKTRNYRSLTVTLAIAFMALSAIVLLITSCLDMYFNFRTQRRIIFNQQQLIAQDAANTVKNFIKEKFNVLDAAVRLGDMAVPQQVERKLILEKLLGLEPAFRQLVLLNTQKEQVQRVARVSNLGLGQLSEWLGNDLLSNMWDEEKYVGPIYIDEVSSEPMVVMAVRIKNVFGDFKGLLVAEVNLKFMWDLVDNIEIGNKGFAYVVDKQGDLIAFGDISRVLRGENLIRLDEVKKFVNDNEFGHKEKANVSKGIEDTYVATTQAHLGVPDWAVIVELPITEAYEPIIMGFRLTLCVMFLSLLLAIIAGIYLSKRITRPIKDLRNATRNISKGNWNTKIEVKSKDEIGQLAVSFNQMVEDLNETTVSRDSLMAEITERKKAEAALLSSEERFKQVAENAGEWIWEVDTKGLFTYSSPVVEKILGYTTEEIVGKKHFYDLMPPDAKEKIKTVAFEIFAKKEPFKGLINPTVHKNGNFVILETNGTPILDDKGDLLGYRGADIDITERKRAESELHETQKQLVETAHKAGMAEVATDVLHNVGNVLNSINVSTALITEKVSKSKLSNLEKVAGIINDHIEDLGTFLVEDPQGKHVPVYLTEVSKLLNNEHAEILSTLRVLNENVEHVKNIVGMQQSYAKVSGVEVSVSLTELVEDAIQINIAALERHGVQIKYELADLPPVEIDKQRVLQILVNLINNAKYALATGDIQGKLVTIRLYEHSDSRLRIEVSDNGVGISEENLSKIFNHGFTTKKDGHGFGLHSGALAAVELGGSLTAHSDGLGQGAKFTLELPFKSVEVNQRKTNATDTNVSQVNG